jgi:hypothetical protein
MFVALMGAILYFITKVDACENITNSRLIFNMAVHQIHVTTPTVRRAVFVTIHIIRLYYQLQRVQMMICSVMVG